LAMFGEIRNNKNAKESSFRVNSSSDGGYMTMVPGQAYPV